MACYSLTCPACHRPTGEARLELRTQVGRLMATLENSPVDWPDRRRAIREARSILRGPRCIEIGPPMTKARSFKAGSSDDALRLALDILDDAPHGILIVKYDHIVEDLIAKGHPHTVAEAAAGLITDNWRYGVPRELAGIADRLKGMDSPSERASMIRRTL